MYEFTIINNKTNEETIIFGYSYTKAMGKRGYDINDYTLLFREYID